KLWAVRRIGEIIDELDLKGKNDELVQELLALSTKHGVLTPYTAFLADDQGTAPLSSSANFNATRMRLRQLERADGAEGFYQRAQKKALQGNAIASQSSIRRALGDALDRPASGGVGGGGSFGGLPGAPGAFRPNSRGAGRGTAADAKEAGAKLAYEETVLGIGNEALYRRGKVWVASNAKDVDLAKDKAKMKQVTRFSEDYFKLVAANSAAENALFAQQQTGQELLIRLRGELYLIK
ncbi:MAG: hypothetical protein QF805_23690, partial [Pirellulaceae bacterium]|nr:hypothetical protein [Pirellulaceae bacterium]